VNEFNGKQRAEELSNSFEDLSRSVQGFRESIRSTIQMEKQYNEEKYMLYQNLLGKLDLELATIGALVVLRFISCLS
jgi:hypothetical protein